MHIALLGSLITLAPMLSGFAKAQTPPLVLDIQGGSMPGSFALDLSAPLYPLEPVVLLMSATPGPTPIALFDPADPRSVQVGLTSIASVFSLFPIGGHFVLGPSPVPVSNSLVDLPFYFQGLTINGPTTFVDRLSNPAVLRLAPAGAFRDRGAATTDDRAFAQVLPRADGRWMVAGGGRGALLAQVAWATTEIYDDVTDSFVPGPVMTSPRSLHRVTELLDGRWIVTGGVDYNNDPQDLCEVYDPAADTFSPVAPMITPRTGHSATLLPDGRVFVAGGLAAMTVVPTPLEAIFDTTNATEIYDPVADTWTAGPNLRTPRAGHVAILRPNGTVLLAGGISWDNLILFLLPAVRSNSDIFDPVAGTMSNGPSMSTPHSLIEPIDLGGNRWLVAGGINALTLANPGTTTAVAEIYDAAANTWSAAGAMSAARGNHQGVALGGGRFLVAGGADGTIQAPNPLAIGEIYDANTNTWSSGPSLTVPRAGAAAFLTPRGQWHVLGGGTAGGIIAHSTEWYFF